MRVFAYIRNIAMIGCPLCGEYSPSLTQLLKHIRLVHADEPGFNLQCGIQGCSRTFRKYQTFRNHVYAIHGTCTGTPHVQGDKETTLTTEQNEGEDDVYVQGVQYDHDASQDDVTDDASQDDVTDDASQDDVTDDASQDDVTDDASQDDVTDDASQDVTDDASQDDVTDDALQRAAALFILKTRENHRIPLSIMDSIIGDVSSLYKLALSAIKKQVISILQGGGLNDGVESALTDLFDTSHFANVFLGLETHHRQLQYIKRNFNFVVLLYFVFIYMMIMLYIVFLGTGQDCTRCGTTPSWYWP